MSSSESFKRLPKKRKFDLSDFEIPNADSTHPKVSLTSSPADKPEIATPQRYPPPSFQDKQLTTAPEVQKDGRESNGAPSAITENPIIINRNGNQHGNHDNRHSPPQFHTSSSSSTHPVELRNIIPTQHHNMSGSINHTGNMSSHAAVIVSSPSRHSLIITESQGLASKALINPQLDTHLSMGQGGGSLLTSGGNYSPSVTPQQQQQPSIAHHESKAVVYAAYGSNPNRNIHISPVYSNSGGSRDASPLSSYSINSHQYPVSQQTEQPMDLGRRSNSSGQNPAGDPSYSSLGTTHNMTQHQQPPTTTIINYRSRSPSPSYRIQQHHLHKTSDSVQQSTQRTVQHGPPQASLSTSHHQQYSTYRGIVQPSKVVFLFVNFF